MLISQRGKKCRITSKNGGGDADSTMRNSDWLPSSHGTLLRCSGEQGAWFNSMPKMGLVKDSELDKCCKNYSNCKANSKAGQIFPGAGYALHIHLGYLIVFSFIVSGIGNSIQSPYVFEAMHSHYEATLIQCLYCTFVSRCMRAHTHKPIWFETLTHSIIHWQYIQYISIYVHIFFMFTCAHRVNSLRILDVNGGIRSELETNKREDQPKWTKTRYC